MRAGAVTPGEEQRFHRLGLAGLILGLALGAVVLYLAAGPPRLPDSLPNWETIQITLRGSELPLAAVAYVLTTAAWLLWLWIALSFLLRLIVGIADARTGGAVWVGVLRTLSDRTTLPVIRRLVDGALVAVVVVNLVSAPVPVAAAAPFPPPAAMTASVMPAATPKPDRAPIDVGSQATRYTVQPGDTLWVIAERFYGTGFAYPKLVDANAGREMPGGGRFTLAGVIQPGWELEIPSPAGAAVAGTESYVVQPEETLGSIAGHRLGDESRWRELFDLNRGTARLDDGRTLTDPNLIWPGLSLRLPPERAVPLASSPAADPPVAAPAGASAAQPVPEPDLSPTTITQEPAAPPVSPSPALIPSRTPAPSMIEQAASLAASLSLPPTYIATLAAAITALGGATLLARRRSRRSLAEPPPSLAGADGPTIRDGFVEVNLARTLSRPIHTNEAELMVLIVQHVLRFLHEQGLQSASVVTVQQGQQALTLTLRVDPAEQDRVPALVSHIGTRLGCTGQASLTHDHDVLLQLTNLKLGRVMLPPVHPFADSLCLVPLGMLPNRELLYANWPELGHVLVAGMTGTGPETTLTSLISALCARFHPDKLRLWTVASSATLPGELAELPHQVRGFIDPDARDDVHSALAEFRKELTRRMRQIEPDGSSMSSSEANRPIHVLLISELTDLEDEAAMLDTIGMHGPTHGMHLLAAATHIDGLDEERLAPFTTRLVLQTLNEEQSIRLLSRPDAADLGEGGDALLRIDGRLPVRLRGFRVAGEDLHRLVQVMRAEFGQQSVDEQVEPKGADANEIASEASLAPIDVQSPPGISAPVLKHEDPITAASEGPIPDEACEEDVPPGIGSQENEDLRPQVLEAPKAVRPGDILTAETTVSDGRDAGGALAATPIVHQGAVEVEPNGLRRTPLIRVRCFGRLRVMSGDRELSPAGTTIGSQY